MKMREVDIETWNRKDAFRFFFDFEDPYFSITADVDATGAYHLSKGSGLPFSLVTLHSALKAANSIREFRMRFLGGKLIEFDAVNGSQVVMHEDETFSFCFYDYSEDLGTFINAGLSAQEAVRNSKKLDENPDRYDQIYFSVIPWVSFSSFKNAQRRDESMTVPRIVFGKFREHEGRMLMPVAVEVNHSMMDGLHVGRFFERLEEIFRNLK